MQHKGTKSIETKRLLLRQFTINDAQNMYDNWTSDYEVTKFLRWPTHNSIEVTQKVLNSWLPLYENNDFYQWAIVFKDINEPIGTISVVEQNEELNMVHIGYCIGSQWWGNGFMSEAFSAIISFLFNEVEVNRIESQHDPKNPGSGKVMEKCGLTYEGTLREADISNQGIVDAAMYSIIAKDYYNR